MTSNYGEILDKARLAYASGKTRTLEFRQTQLKKLLNFCEQYEQEMIAALGKDLRRPKQECLLLELEYMKNDILNTLYNLKEWMEPEKPEKGVVNLMDDVVIYNEPYGVTLIMGAWNYPFQLLLVPVVAAIAAGNCCVIKPSEVAANSAKLIADVLPKYLDPVCYPVICGGVEETTELLKQRFDYIFYTGSTRVGQIVYAAANKYLTPVTLELGGKSPCYIDDNVDISIVTRRVLWGKLVNAGQTCIAPDYVLCSKETEKKFVAEAKNVLTEWYGNNIKSSPDFCRIINERNFQRITGLLKSSVTVAVGGSFDANERYVEPTILVNVSQNDAIMQEEIFGPILPVVNVTNAFDAIRYIKSGETPLALYVFSADKQIQKAFINGTQSGGMCINDTLMHLAVDTLPFGGLGFSGMGAYHGKYGFETFSHKKSCLIKNLSKFGEKLQVIRYPPYDDKKISKLLMLLKKRKPFPKLPFGYLLTFALGFGSAFLLATYLRTNSSD